MTTLTWIIFKADNMSAHGWEERKLLPGGSLTDILWENWDYSGRLPQAGDLLAAALRYRTRGYTNLEDPNNGITHGCDGDWIVQRVLMFSSPDTEQRIVVCYCSYQPVERHWEEVNRGVPVSEMLEPVNA